MPDLLINFCLKEHPDWLHREGAATVGNSAQVW